MSEYKSLESVIKETMLKDLRKRMEEATLKRGKVTAEVVSDEGKQDIGHDPSAVNADGAGGVVESTSPESLVELSKKTLGSYVKKATKVLPGKEIAIDDTYRSMWDNHRKDPKFRKVLDKQERQVANHHKGVERAVNRLTKEEVEPVEELMDDMQSGGAQDPVKQKLAQQKQQLQKQKEQIRLQIAQQRAAKQEQKMKQNAEKALQKEEEELDEWMPMPYRGVRTFKNANRLLQLHQNRFQNLSRQNDPRSRKLAMLHRERAIELKRLAYNAKDNPEKLPTL